jgi:V/A-type H+-transporting ATPase subunit F
LYKLIVLTDPDNADGFRLAGVDVVVVDSDEQVRERLNRLLDEEASGIIAVNEKMMAAIDERTQRKIDSIYRPLVISLPLRDKLAIGDDHRAYLARLIRRAIGFDITLRRG